MAIYSHSRIETFEICPLKFKFRYLDKVETPVEETVEAFVGSRVHVALEKLYDDLHYEKRNSLEDLLAFYQAEWRKNWSAGIQITRAGMTEQNYFDYGERCIRAYYERHQPFDDSQTLATELHLTFALDEAGEFKVQGFVDRAARRADGTYEIHDYKTGRSVPSQEDADSDRQLALYQIGLRQRWPDAGRVELIWHYVGRDAELRSRRTPEELARLRAATIEKIREIEAEKDYEPVKGPYCDWCEYQSVCPVWKHVFAVRALPPDAFAAEEGVKLANEFAATKRQLAALKEREEGLRERLVEFCRRKKLKTVQGSAVRVQVKIGERPALPRKDEARRDELEKFVRDTGRWGEVSSLDTHALGRVLKEKTWPAKLLDRLRDFARMEETVTVSLQREKAPED